MVRKYINHNSYIYLYIFSIIFISLGQKIFFPLTPNNKNIQIQMNKNIVGNISLNHDKLIKNKKIIFSNTAQIKKEKLFLEITLLSAKKKVDLKPENIISIFKSKKNKLEVNKNIIKIREKNTDKFYKCFEEKNKLTISKINKIKSLFSLKKSTFFDCLLISSYKKTILEKISYEKNNILIKN